MQGFDCKILPEGVEIFQQSKCLDLAKCRQNKYLCNLISTVLEVDKQSKIAFYNINKVVDYFNRYVSINGANLNNSIKYKRFTFMYLYE